MKMILIHLLPTPGQLQASNTANQPILEPGTNPGTQGLSFNYLKRQKFGTLCEF